MDNRERVIREIVFDRKDYIPHSISFNTGIYQRMKEYTGISDYQAETGSHITEISLMKPEKELRPGYFEDEYGVVWNRTGADKDVGVVDNLVIAEPEQIAAYHVPKVDEAYVRSRMEWLEAQADGNFHMPAISFSLFERAWTLCGMENLLCYMITDPDAVHELMKKICERNLEVIDIALQYEIDGFYFGDDWGQQKGLIMGPGYWREFVKPYMAKMYGKVKEAGKYIAQHSCGDLRDIMDDVIDMGLNIYQTYQPEIYGLEYAECLKGRLCIWGGISTQADLPYKTPQEIKKITQKLLAAFPEGGLIAAPTHGIPDDVPPENVEAMMEVLLGQKGRQ